jgi:hypothetical protein
MTVMTMCVLPSMMILTVVAILPIHSPSLAVDRDSMGGAAGGDDILAYVKALRQQHRDGLL